MNTRQLRLKLERKTVKAGETADDSAGVVVKLRRTQERCWNMSAAEAQVQKTFLELQQNWFTRRMVSSGGHMGEVEMLAQVRELM